MTPERKKRPNYVGSCFGGGGHALLYLCTFFHNYHHQQYTILIIFSLSFSYYPPFWTSIFFLSREVSVKKTTKSRRKKHKKLHIHLGKRSSDEKLSLLWLFYRGLTSSNFFSLWHWHLAQRKTIE